MLNSVDYDRLLSSVSKSALASGLIRWPLVGFELLGRRWIDPPNRVPKASYALHR